MGEPVNFACRSCGKECASAGPDGAICEDCCEDHDYRYERELRGHFCFHCGKPAPEDWFDD